MTKITGLSVEMLITFKDDGLRDTALKNWGKRYSEALEKSDERDYIRSIRCEDIGSDVLEYTFSEYDLSIRVHKNDEDYVHIVAYRNVPMQYFYKQFEDFCREILDVRVRDAEFEHIPDWYLFKVKKGVDLLWDLYNLSENRNQRQ